MKIDKPVPPAMKEGMKLTKEQEAELQDFLDERTVFGLAVLMVDLHTMSLLKNKQGIVNAVMKAGVLIRNNPGFVLRFRDAQREAIENIQKASPKDLRADQPPTVSLIDRSTPELTDEQIEKESDSHDAG